MNRVKILRVPAVKNPNMELKGKVVLITGAVARLGRVLAEALAGEGCDLVIHYNRSVAGAEALVRQLRRNGRRAAAIKCDLRAPGAGENLIKRSFHVMGGLDILVNNAASFSKIGLRNCSEKQLRSELELNLMAPVFMARSFAKVAGKGKIINILDRRIAGLESGMAAYLLSKQALASFTRIAALELAPDISVNGVAPGPVLPPSGAGNREKAGKIPLARRPCPNDVADAVIFLLKTDAITGQIVFVDGGQHLLGNNCR